MGSVMSTANPNRKAYKPGDVIVENCQPLFKVLNFTSTERGKICDYCFKTPSGDKSLIKCGTLPHDHCHLMFYCSKECQRADWINGHKLECSSPNWIMYNFSTADSHPLVVELRFQLFRSLAFLYLNPKEAKKPYKCFDPNISIKCFNDILALPDTVHSVQSHFNRLTAELYSEARAEKLDTGEIVPDCKFFAKIMRILQTNGIPIYTKNQTSIHPDGMAIFVERSLFKHSCKPTAIFCPSSDGTNFQIRAIAEIAEGEYPTISYLAYHPQWPIWEYNVHYERAKRQELLKGRFGFESDCKCDICKTNVDASIDFEKLNSDIQFFVSCNETEENEGRNYSANDFLLKHDSIIAALNKMYHDYDDHVTAQYLLTFKALKATFLDQDLQSFLNIPKFRRFIEEAKNHVGITYGKGHSKYNILSNFDSGVRPSYKSSWEFIRDNLPVIIQFMKPSSSEPLGSYKPGDIIQRNCVPLFSVNQFMAMNKGKFCDVCFHPAETKTPGDANKILHKCSKCKFTYYCSETCQMNDWNNGHKVECESKAWRHTFDISPPEDVVFDLTRVHSSEVELRCQLFRAIAILKMNPQLLDQEFRMYDGKTCSFKKLLEKQTVKKAWMIELPVPIPLPTHYTCSKLANEIEKEKLNIGPGPIVVDFSFIIKMTAIIMANANTDRMGTNTRPSPSRINIFVERAAFKHSCKPTAIFCNNLNENNMADIRAIADIPEGEKPTIATIDCLKGYKERRSILRLIPNIELCMCERCVNQSDASVNFDQLYAHQQFFKGAASTLHGGRGRGIGRTDSFKNFLKKHKEMIDWMNKMYHKYDEQVSKHYLNVVLAIGLHFAEPKHILQFGSQMNVLMEEAKDHLSITYGKKHPDYRKLMEVIENIWKQNLSRFKILEFGSSESDSLNSC